MRLSYSLPQCLKYAMHLDLVLFYADLTQYGDPLLDQLDIHGVVHHRLFRESCYNHQGNYVKVCAPTTL
jgi:RNA polymerase II subunit A small phosphatase-like protein